MNGIIIIRNDSVNNFRRKLFVPNLKSNFNKTLVSYNIVYNIKVYIIFIFSDDTDILKFNCKLK